MLFFQITARYSRPPLFIECDIFSPSKEGGPPPPSPQSVARQGGSTRGRGESPRPAGSKAGQSAIRSRTGGLGVLERAGYNEAFSCPRKKLLKSETLTDNMFIIPCFALPRGCTGSSLPRSQEEPTVSGLIGGSRAAGMSLPEPTPPRPTHPPSLPRGWWNIGLLTV